MYHLVPIVPRAAAPETMEDPRPRIRAEKGTIGMVRALGEKHDLAAPDAYGKALEFVVDNQDEFENWLAEHEPADDEEHDT